MYHDNYHICNYKSQIFFGMINQIMIRSRQLIQYWLVVLIIKAAKTSPRTIVGMDITCKKYVTRTNRLSCPKCKNKSQSFGV